jgi:hypothetical protein
MVIMMTLMGSRYFGGGLAKVGGSPGWATRPWSTLRDISIVLILNLNVNYLLVEYFYITND